MNNKKNYEKEGRSCNECNCNFHWGFFKTIEEIKKEKGDTSIVETPEVSTYGGAYYDPKTKEQWAKSELMEGDPRAFDENMLVAEDDFAEIPCKECRDFIRKAGLEKMATSLDNQAKEEEEK